MGVFCKHLSCLQQFSVGNSNKMKEWKIYIVSREREESSLFCANIDWILINSRVVIYHTLSQEEGRRDRRLITALLKRIWRFINSLIVEKTGQTEGSLETFSFSQKMTIDKPQRLPGLLVAGWMEACAVTWEREQQCSVAKCRSRNQRAAPPPRSLPSSSSGLLHLKGFSDVGRWWWKQWSR